MTVCSGRFGRKVDSPGGVPRWIDDEEEGRALRGWEASGRSDETCAERSADGLTNRVFKQLPVDAARVSWGREICRSM